MKAHFLVRKEASSIARRASDKSIILEFLFEGVQNTQFKLQ